MNCFKRLTSVFEPAAAKAAILNVPLSPVSRESLQRDTAMTPFSMRMAWKLVSPYFKSEEKYKAWGMLGSTLGLAVSQVLVNLAINDWWRQWIDTLPNHDVTHFMMRAAEAVPLASALMLTATLGLYCGQAFKLNWRNWATGKDIGAWLGQDADKPYFYMATRHPEIDNPDQRITENLLKFIDNTVDLGLGLFTNSISLGSFACVLWEMSDKFNLASLGGPDFTFYHPLAMAAAAYGAYGIYQIRKIGEPLSALTAKQQKLEADLRTALMNIRDNAASIAALGGEKIEKAILNEKLRLVVQNMWEVYCKNRHLLMFNVPYQFAGRVLPVLADAPLVLAGGATIGSIFQSIDAFANVLTSLGWYAFIVPQIAEWKASCARVLEFQSAAAGAKAEAMPAQPNEKADTPLNDVRPRPAVQNQGPG